MFHCRFNFTDAVSDYTAGKQEIRLYVPRLVMGVTTFNVAVILNTDHRGNRPKSF